MKIPVVFINLDSDGERRKRMEAEFKRLQVNAQRLDAVRWTSLEPEKQATFYSESLNKVQYHSPLVAGEKGCYASHLLAWQDLLNSKAQAMVVLEDDVKLTDNFVSVIDSITQLERPWDMIKLIGREKEKVRDRQPLCEGVDLVDYRRIPSLTAGYVISRSGAQKLLSSRRPFGRPIDVDLRYWWENQMHILGVTPAMLILDETSFVSSIGNKVHQRRLFQKWKKFQLKFKMNILNWAHNFNKKSLS
jgi:glycosyl transferase family 25